MTGNSQGQAIENTSYKNEAGERVLRIECTIPIKVSDAWKLFTNDEKLKKWMNKWNKNDDDWFDHPFAIL